MPDESRTYSDLQPNDVVLIQSRQATSVRTVERTTKTQVIIDNALRFNRNTGRAVGYTAFDSPHLIVPTQTEIEAAKAEIEHHRLANYMRKHPWSRRSLGALREIREILLRDIDA